MDDADLILEHFRKVVSECGFTPGEIVTIAHDNQTTGKAFLLDALDVGPNGAPTNPHIQFAYSYETNELILVQWGDGVGVIGRVILPDPNGFERMEAAIRALSPPSPK